MIACSKFLYCDDCTANDCYWVAFENETSFCFHDEDEMGGRSFPYYSGPEDGKNGCPPWSWGPEVQASKSSAGKWVLIGLLILFAVLALAIAIYKKGRGLLRAFVFRFGLGVPVPFPLRRANTEIELQELPLLPPTPLRRLETIPEEMEEIPL